MQFLLRVCLCSEGDTVAIARATALGWSWHCASRGGELAYLRWEDMTMDSGSQGLYIAAFRQNKTSNSKSLTIYPDSNYWELDVFVLQGMHSIADAGRSHYRHGVIEDAVLPHLA